ncbi:hypothetical protein ACA910_019202 [Epithemia clementina (nom. ined.)]
MNCVGTAFLQDEKEARRKLQLDILQDQRIAPEFAIFALGALALSEFSLYETPVVIRYTSLFGIIRWNCIATYSSNFNDVATKERPAVVVTDTSMHTSYNRARCLAQAQGTYNTLIGWSNEEYISAMAYLGVSVETAMDADVAACESDACLQAIAVSKNFSPTIMGHIIAKKTHDFAVADGFNELGTEGCVVNCRPFRDTTGYKPVVLDDNANQNTKKKLLNRWQPLIEDNRLGFFFKQEHVTPHIGLKAKFRFLPESARTTQNAPVPNYSKTYASEIQDVFRRMSQLDDKKKIEIEQHDSKVNVAGAVVLGFIQKLLAENYVDSSLGVAGHVLSYERIIHFDLVLTGAEYDATLIAWKEKVKYDLARPTTLIKRTENTNITTWTPKGVLTYPAKDFEAYIRVMPHSEYVSGSSCLFQAVEELTNDYMTRIGLDPNNFTMTFPTVPAGGSKVEPGQVPAVDYTLSYPNGAALALGGSNSRLNGGMHFEQSVAAGKIACTGVGSTAVAQGFELIGG